MGYTYGHPKTAWTGIQLWLAGWTHQKERKPNYIPKNLDINQKAKFCKQVVVAYVQSKGVDTTMKKWYLDHNKNCKKVQDNFQDFVKFVQANYEKQ